MSRHTLSHLIRGRIFDLCQSKRDWWTKIRAVRAYRNINNEEFLRLCQVLSLVEARGIDRPSDREGGV